MRATTVACCLITAAGLLLCVIAGGLARAERGQALATEKGKPPSRAAVRRADSGPQRVRGRAVTSAPVSRDAEPRQKVRRPKRTVFAAPFENVTGQDQYDPAAAGMGDLVAVLLAHQEDIAVVERQRLLALAEEQAAALKGLRGSEYGIRAGKLLKADTVLTGRLFLVKDKLTISVKAIDIASERLVASDQISCRPTYLVEAGLQLARKLGEQLSLPLPKIDLKDIDKSPLASLHFGKALSRYYAGDMDGAILQFMRAVDLEPDYVEAHYWAGMCYHRLGQDAHAIIEWEEFLRRWPNSEHAKELRKLLAEAKRRKSTSTVGRLGPTTRAGSGPASTRPAGGGGRR